jgi:hypothetical protein
MEPHQHQHVTSPLATNNTIITTTTAAVTADPLSPTIVANATPSVSLPPTPITTRSAIDAISPSNDINNHIGTVASPPAAVGGGIGNGSILTADDIESLSESDRKLLHQIRIDCRRTTPDMKFFQSADAAKSLERILFVWAMRHPASGYIITLCPTS